MKGVLLNMGWDEFPGAITARWRRAWPFGVGWSSVQILTLVFYVCDLGQITQPQFSHEENNHV